eukprot:TRINITY_DN27915_c0_g1_i3.p1 TRINITY_DN27915_c0_g1~~TRINITY_DN27915_c0_g1_i3.p1  ORF type:complete len:942 (+),score=174.95 TRINITY_DN27915_c0_g1_i3:207-3032(+)
MSDPFFDVLKNEFQKIQHELWASHQQSLQQVKGHAYDLMQENERLREKLRGLGQHIPETTAHVALHLMKVKKVRSMDAKPSGFSNQPSTSSQGSARRTAPREEATRRESTSSMVSMKSINSVSGKKSRQKRKSNTLKLPLHSNDDEQDAPSRNSSQSSRWSSPKHSRSLMSAENEEIRAGEPATQPSLKSVDKDDLRVDDVLDALESSESKADAVDSFLEVHAENEPPPVKQGFLEVHAENEPPPVKQGSSAPKPAPAISNLKQAGSSRPKIGVGRVLFLGEENDGHSSDSEEERDGSNADSDSSSDAEEYFALAEAWKLKVDAHRRSQANVVLQRKSTKEQNKFGESDRALSEEGDEVTRFQSVLDRTAKMCCYDKNVPLHPNSRFVIFWEISSFVLLMFDVFTIPLSVFNIDENYSPFFFVTTWVTRIWWTIDIAVSFLTGYNDKIGRLETHAGMVAKRYMSRQFPLDLLVVLSDWTESITGMEGSSVAKSWRIIRITRFLRLKKARDIMIRLSAYMRSEALSLMASIVRLLFTLVAIMHFLACAWYGIGKLSSQKGMHSWVVEVIDEPAHLQYLRSIHSSIALFHGEQLERYMNSEEVLFMTFVTYFIFVGNAWLVSVITTAMTRLEIVSTRRSQMLNELDRWIYEANLSYELAFKVQRSAKKGMDEMEKNVPEEKIQLLHVISDPLRMEAHFEIYSRVLFMHPFFACYARVNPGGVRQVCHKAVSQIKVSNGDVIFHEKEQATEPFLYFVVSGQLKYSKPSEAGDEPVKVGVDNWLAEGMLWLDEWIHVGTLKAEGDCLLLAVDCKKIQDFFSSMQSGHARLYGELFTDAINESKTKGELTDVGEYTIELGRMLNQVFAEDWQPLKGKYQAKLGLPQQATLGATFGRLSRLSSRKSQSVAGQSESAASSRVSWFTPKSAQVVPSEAAKRQVRDDDDG